MRLQVLSLDREAEFFFEVSAGVLQGDTLGP